ncbi:MAG: GNAT family N-acetyltransferase [Bacteroidales bacterium]
MGTAEIKYSLHSASSESEYRIAKALFLEYAGSLEFDLCFQHFDKELDEIQIQYGSHSGGIVLLKSNEDYAGCAGIRKFDEDIAELKRMYIKPSFRGCGFGKPLLNAAIDLAQSLGYKKMRLDTISTMKAAIKLYIEAGFKETEPYRFNPVEGVRYFEMDISKT